jgi:hypothetical protein
MQRATGPPSRSLTAVVATDSGHKAGAARRATQAAVRRVTEANFGPTGSSTRQRKSSIRSVSIEDPNINRRNMFGIFSSHRPETWTHYLHIVDTLETAAACGLSLRPHRSDEPALAETPYPISPRPPAFERLIGSWFPLTYVLNNLNRGLGLVDAYPFVLSPPAVNKLRFVHEVVARAKTRRRERRTRRRTTQSPG